MSAYKLVGSLIYVMFTGVLHSHSQANSRESAVLVWCVLTRDFDTLRIFDYKYDVSW